MRFNCFPVCATKKRSAVCGTCRSLNMQELKCGVMDCSMDKRLMQGWMEGKRRGRPAMTWFQDMEEWTKLDMVDASQQTTDQARWWEIINVTAAQRAPPD